MCSSDLENNACKSLAFPLISAGIYGYPKADALKIAVNTIQDFLSRSGDEMDIVIALFGDDMMKIAHENFPELAE